jgi:hypothetical protein
MGVDGLSAQLVGQSVVDIPVMRFVCANHAHHVAQRRVVRQLPVPFRAIAGAARLGARPASISARYCV